MQHWTFPSSRGAPLPTRVHFELLGLDDVDHLRAGGTVYHQVQGSGVGIVAFANHWHICVYGRDTQRLCMSRLLDTVRNLLDKAMSYCPGKSALLQSPGLHWPRRSDGVDFGPDWWLDLAQVRRDEGGREDDRCHHDGLF